LTSLRFAALVLAGVLPLSAFGSGRAAVAAPATTCTVTRVRYTPYHGSDPAATPPIPWVAATPRSSHIVGFLYFNPPGVTGEAAYPHVHGNGPASGSSDKILWYLTRGVGKPKLKISGTNLTTPDTMHAIFPEAVSPANDYPSILNVGSAGCWRLTVRDGKLKGHVTFDVLP